MFALFGMLAAGGRGGERRVDSCPKASSPHPTPQSVGKSLYRWREGATGRNSTVGSGSHLDIGHALV